MATASQIIQRAYQRLGVLGAGEAARADDAELGFGLLNGIIDQWAAQSIYVYAVSMVPLTLVQGVGAYTVGPSGDVAASSVPPALVSMPTYDLGGSVRQVSVINQAPFSAIIYPAQAGPPEVAYYAPGPTLGTLNLWPLPDAPYVMQVPIGAQLVAFPDQGTEVSLVHGYLSALEWTLAEEAQSTFGRELSITDRQRAKNARDVIRRNNLRPADIGLPCGSGFNILTGGC